MIAAALLIAALLQAAEPLPPVSSGRTPPSDALPPPDAQDLASLGDVPGSTGTVAWNAVPVMRRYVMIMGTSDGFAAAGVGAPCFPGRSNSAIDQELAASGFSEQDSSRLPAAMKAIAADPSKCVDVGRRSYDSAFLLRMNETDLAAYLTSVVSGYTTVKPCPASKHAYAATLAITAIGMAEDDANPVEPLRIALDEACAATP